MPLLARFLIFSLCCCFAFLIAGAAQAQRRVAFVVGNEAYRGRDLPPLNNPASDAALIADVLERIGFEVWPKGRRTDLAQTEMNAALFDFRAAAQGAEIGLIYYAGHGLQDGGGNYFFAIDADPYDLETLRQQSFSLTGLMSNLSGVTRLRIGLFDACRDNRLVASLRRQEQPTRAAMIDRGMARVQSLPGDVRSLIAFPTEAGLVTPDGVPGSNSAFAKALARHLPNPDLEIRLLFGHVADEVQRETQRYRPEVSTNLGGDAIHLAMRAPPVRASANVAVPPLAVPLREPKLALTLDQSSITGVAFSPDGRRALTGSWYTVAQLWDAQSGAEIRRLKHEEWVTGVAFSPDGRRILTGSLDKTARIWIAETGAEILRLPHENLVESVAFGPDGRRVLTGSWDGVARIWDLGSGEEIRRLTQGGVIRSVAFSPDGRRVVIGSSDKTARIWSVETGEEIHDLQHEDQVRSVAFSPDGGRVLTGSDDHAVRIWNAETGAEIRKLAHEEQVRSVAFSPDGGRVLTGSSDRTARVWNAGTGAEISRMYHKEEVYSVAFSPDGGRVLTGGGSRLDQTKIWELR